MTHPRAKGRFVRHTARTAAAAYHLPRRARRAAGQVAAAAATRLRQPLNGGHRRQCLSPPLGDLAQRDADILVVLANTLHELAHSLHGLEIPLLPRAAVNRAYRLALATKLGGTALARLWPRFAQCSRNMPSMARSSAGLISRECATVTE